MLRGIAAGNGVHYNNLAQDLEGVNYSSIRQVRLMSASIGRRCRIC
jgi:capsid protein